MTQPVLCAVDISNGMDDVKTVKVAAQMAALSGAQLDVIAVVPDYGMSPVGSFFNEDHHEIVVNEGRALVNALVTEALGATENEKVNHVVATGRAYDEVLKLASKIDPSLIVIGARKVDFADYLLGPNAARIVRHANTSVYVVR